MTLDDRIRRETRGIRDIQIDHADLSPLTTPGNKIAGPIVNAFGALLQQQAHGSVETAASIAGLSYLSLLVYLPVGAEADDSDQEQDDDEPQFSCETGSQKSQIHTHAPIDNLLYHLGPVAFQKTTSSFKSLIPYADLQWKALTSSKTRQFHLQRFRNLKPIAIDQANSLIYLPVLDSNDTSVLDIAVCHVTKRPRWSIMKFAGAKLPSRTAMAMTHLKVGPKNLLVCFGGKKADSELAGPEIIIIDVEMQTWQTAIPTGGPVVGRIQPNMISKGNTIWVFGGENNHLTPIQSYSILEYNIRPQGWTWTVADRPFPTNIPRFPQLGHWPETCHIKLGGREKIVITPGRVNDQPADLRIQNWLLFDIQNQTFTIPDLSRFPDMPIDIKWYNLARDPARTDTVLVYVCRTEVSEFYDCQITTRRDPSVRIQPRQLSEQLAETGTITSAIVVGQDVLMLAAECFEYVNGEIPSHEKIQTLYKVKQVEDSDDE
ncbi:hypothetical protein C8J56DRAFT_1173218 [Mycena floridula]|nr:hypothetical protein C8J56DRAFT_1173218 [Mycena floridula]